MANLPTVTIRPYLLLSAAGADALNVSTTLANLSNICMSIIDMMLPLETFEQATLRMGEGTGPGLVARLLLLLRRLNDFVTVEDGPLHSDWTRELFERILEGFEKIPRVWLDDAVNTILADHAAMLDAAESFVGGVVDFEVFQAAADEFDTLIPFS